MNLPRITVTHEDGVSYTSIDYWNEDGNFHAVDSDGYVRVYIGAYIAGHTVNIPDNAAVIIESVSFIGKEIS